MAADLLRRAVSSHRIGTRRGVLERLFAWAFQRWVYNQIWEDPRVDLQALRIEPDSRIVTIASGGCNVLNYLAADPAHITAVDLNPAHIALTRLKLAALRHLPDQETFFALFGVAHGGDNRGTYVRHLQRNIDAETRSWWEARTWFLGRRFHCFDKGLYRHSLLGRYIGLLHRVAGLTGRNPAHMLRARSLPEQQRIFEETIAPLFDLRLVRVLCRLPIVTYSLGIPPQQQELMATEARGDVAALYRERVRRLACDFPIRENYFAWQAFGRNYDTIGKRALPDYLRAENFELLRGRAKRVDVRLVSMTDFLATQPRGSFDRFVLLDALDWMTPAQLEALWREIRRVALPGARVIFRTAAIGSPLEPLPDSLLRGWEYEKALGQALHLHDRSAIYGGFHVYSFRS